MKILRATNQRTPVLVDDEDYGMLSEFNWRINEGGYVVRSKWNNDRKTCETIYMHRFIMNTPQGLDCEHWDLNRANNQKANLRASTRSQNMANTRSRSGLSKYKGVSLLKREKLKKPWLAYLRHNYKQYHLGYFSTQEEAAEAYNKKAKELFGQFARLNIIEEVRDEKN